MYVEAVGLQGAHLYFEEGSRFVNSHKTREFPRFELFNKHSEPSGAACIRLCYTKTTIASTMVLLKEITETLEPYPDLHDSLPFLDAYDSLSESSAKYS